MIQGLHPHPNSLISETVPHINNFAVCPVQALQTTVRSIRNARAEYGVELGRKIPATILVTDESLR